MSKILSFHHLPWVYILINVFNTLDIIASGSDDRNIRLFKIPDDFDKDIV